MSKGKYMRSRTKTMLLTGAVALAGAGAFGAVAVNAATSNGTSLASAIATKFGLKQADVQAVIDAQHTSRQAQHEQALETRLDAAVTAGAITADQKTKILAKIKEFEATRQASRDALTSKTPAERRAAMEADRASLEKWAADNKIPADLLTPGGQWGHMGNGLMGGRGMMGGHGTDADDGPVTN